MVTLSLLLEEQFQNEPLYVPKPGTEYEVAEGVTVKMLTPTVARQKAFLEAMTVLSQLEDGQMGDSVVLSLKAAKVIGSIDSGDWPGADEVIPNVLGRLMSDFMSASGVIERPLALSSDALERLTKAIQSKLNGQQSGETVMTDGRT